MGNTQWGKNSFYHCILIMNAIKIYFYTVLHLPKTDRKTQSFNTGVFSTDLQNTSKLKLPTSFPLVLSHKNALNRLYRFNTVLLSSKMWEESRHWELVYRYNFFLPHRVTNYKKKKNGNKLFILQVRFCISKAIQNTC